MARRLACCIASILVAFAALLADSRPTAADVDLIVREVGYGFTEQIVEVCTEDDGGQARAFRGELGSLCIIRSPSINDELIRVFVTSFRDPAGQDFFVGDIDPAVAQVLDADTPNPVFVAAFGAGSYLYTIMFVRSTVDAPDFDAQAFVADLANEHLALVGPSGPATAVPDEEPAQAGDDNQDTDSVSVAGIDDELLFRLADIDGFTKMSSPVPDAHLGAGIAESGEVARALTEGTSSALQFYMSDDGLPVGVLVSRYRFPLFAAATLGDREGLNIDDSIRFPATSARPDMVAVAGGDGTGVGAAFRQGDLFYLLVPASESDVPPDRALPTVGRLAAALYDGGPGGETSPFYFASVPQAVAQTALLMVLSGLLVLAIRLLFARRARRVRRGASASHVLVNVDASAGTIRLRSRLMVVVQLVAVNALVVALAVADGTLAIVLAVAAVTTGVTAGLFARRLDRPHHRGGFALPAFGGVLVGAFAVVALTVGIALLIRGASTWLFTPWLGHLEVSDRLGVDPMRLSQLMVAGGLVLATAGGLINRAARRLGSATAERVRQTDRRREVLYLRSFDDDKLPIPTAATSRRPFLEAFSLLGQEPFEESVAWQLEQHGPVIAVNQPNESLSSLGARREDLSDDWKGGVVNRMSRAQKIVMVIGRSRGLTWELQQLVEQGHLDKTIFVTPPVADDDNRARWARFCSVAAGAGVPMDQTVDPAAALVITLDDHGTQTGYTTARRDEAGYRAALDEATSDLASAGIR